jgi:hypothetical protein
VAFLLCPSVRRGSAGGRGAEEEEGAVGVKRAGLPPSHIYTAGPESWRSWECSTTPTVTAKGRHAAARSGAAATVTAPLGHDDLQ